MARRWTKRKLGIVAASAAAALLIALLPWALGVSYSHVLAVLFALFLILFIGFILWKALQVKEPSEDFERWKNIAEILAILAAGVFFSIQFLNGWTSNNMSTHLTTERYGCEEKFDCVAVHVDLDKGEYGSLKLYRGEVRALDPDTQQQLEGSEVRPLAGTRRVAYTPGTRGNDYRDDSIDWNKPNNRPVRIASNDKVQFAAVLRVPKGRTCIIEVVVITYADLWFPGRGPAQSRSSVVSIPPEFKKAETPGK